MAEKTLQQSARALPRPTGTTTAIPSVAKGTSSPVLGNLTLCHLARRGRALAPNESELNGLDNRTRVAHFKRNKGFGHDELGVVGALPDEGARLPDVLTARLERAFQTEVRDVRVHRDHQPVAGMGARAFASGRDVAFAPGEYDPRSREGQELIAHEVAHVVQQRSRDGLGRPSKDLEREADEAARGAMRGDAFGVFSRAPSRAPQRDDGKGSGHVTSETNVSYDGPLVGQTSDLAPSQESKPEKPTTLTVEAPGLEGEEKEKQKFVLYGAGITRSSTAQTFAVPLKDLYATKEKAAEAKTKTEGKEREALSMTGGDPLAGAGAAPTTPATTSAFDIDGNVVELSATAGGFGITGKFTKLAVGAASTTVIERGGTVTLVDAGVRPLALSGETVAALAQQTVGKLKELIGDRPIAEILISHTHSDHVNILKDIAANFEIGKIRVAQIHLLDENFKKTLSQVAEAQRNRVAERIRKNRAQFEAETPVTPSAGKAEADFEKWVQKKTDEYLANNKPTVKLEVMVPDASGSLHATSASIGEIDVATGETSTAPVTGAFQEPTTSTIQHPEAAADTAEAKRKAAEWEKEQAKLPPEQRKPFRPSGLDKNSLTFELQFPNGKQVLLLPDLREADFQGIRTQLTGEMARLGKTVTFRVFDMGHHLQVGFAGTLSASGLAKFARDLHNLLGGGGGGAVPNVVISSVDLNLVDKGLVWFLRSCGIEVRTAHSAKDVQVIEALTAGGQKVAGFAPGSKDHPGLRPQDPLLDQSSAALIELEARRDVLQGRVDDRDIGKNPELRKQRQEIKDKIDKAPRGSSEKKELNEQLDALVQSQNEALKAARKARNDCIEEIKQLKKAQVDYIDAFRREIAEADAKAKAKPPPKEGDAPATESPEAQTEPAKAQADVLRQKLKDFESEKLAAPEDFHEVSLLVLKDTSVAPTTEEGQAVLDSRAREAELQKQLEAADSPEVRLEIIKELELQKKRIAKVAEDASPTNKTVLNDEIARIDARIAQHDKSLQEMVEKAPATEQRVAGSGVVVETRALKAGESKPKTAQTEEAPTTAEPPKLGAFGKGVEKVAGVVGRASGAVMIFQSITGGKEALEKFAAGNARPLETGLAATKAVLGFQIGARMLSASGSVGLGKFAILSAVDVLETASHEYGTREEQDIAVAKSTVRNAVSLGVAAVAEELAAFPPWGTLVGLGLSFAVDPLLDALGVYDWIEKKLSFMPDEYTDVARALRTLVADYEVLVGAVELAARNDDSLKSVGASDPGAVRDALARAVAEKRSIISAKEWAVLNAFDTAYDEAKTGHAGLEELDSLRDNFLSYYHRIHQGGDAANEVAATGTGGTEGAPSAVVSPQDAGTDGPGLVGAQNDEGSYDENGNPLFPSTPDSTPVTKDHLRTFFEGKDRALSMDSMSAEEVAAMPQWSKMDDAIQELENYLYRENAAIDWKDVAETESHITLMLHNAHYRLSPKSGGLRYESLVSEGTDARAAYERELKIRENKYGVLHARLTNAAAGIEPDRPKMEDTGAEGGPGAPPAPLPPAYGDVEADTAPSAVIEAAQKMLATYKTTLDGMPAIPYGITAETLYSDSTQAISYQSAIDNDDTFKSALYRLKSLESAMRLSVDRAQRVAAGDATLTKKAADLQSDAQKAITARHDIRGYLYPPNEINEIGEKTKAAQAKQVAVALGEGSDVKPLSPSEESAAEGIKDATITTITNRLQKIPGFALGTKDEDPVSGVAFVVGMVDSDDIASTDNVLVGVISDDPPSPIPNQGDALVLRHATILPLNAAAIARLGSAQRKVLSSNLRYVTMKELKDGLAQ